MAPLVVRRGRPYRAGRRYSRATIATAVVALVLTCSSLPSAAEAAPLAQPAVHAVGTGAPAQVVAPTPHVARPAVPAPVVTHAVHVSVVGVANPKANVPRTPAMAQACKNGPDQTCEQAVVQAIDNARAAEGVPPMTLPSFYNSLTEAEQLLVLANLERVDRGLPGFVGLSSELDHMAEQGAATTSDPSGPNGASWGSNWAGGEADALLADYDWMYDDGPGSPNLDCTPSQPSGCWSHRENVLGNYGADPSMGAAATKVNGVTSLAELFASSPPGALDFRLPQAGSDVAVAPAMVLTPRALEMDTNMGLPRLGRLSLTAPLTADASVSIAGNGGHWSVSDTCHSAQGQRNAEERCSLQVRFVGLVPGMAEGTVSVNVHGHIERVHVSAYVRHGFALGSVPVHKLVLL